MYSQDPHFVFDRVEVSFLALGGATVYWSLSPNFTVPPPYSFQLQVGETGNPMADDWADVGIPRDDVYMAVDPTRRATGREWTTHYRVILRTSGGSWTSPPAAADGVLPPHDWAIARDVVRRARLKHGLYAVQGWLLKRRITGITPNPKDPSIAAVDPITQSVLRGRQATAGTPYYSGYYAAFPTSADMSAASHSARVDGDRGTVDDAGLSVSGLIVQFPKVASQDVFVAGRSDRRYYISGVRDAGEWRGVPLVASCEFRLAGANDIVYTVPIPGLPPPVVG